MITFSVYGIYTKRDPLDENMIKEIILSYRTLYSSKHWFALYLLLSLKS